jgi:hypothetical protein
MGGASAASIATVISVLWKIPALTTTDMKTNPTRQDSTIPDSPSGLRVVDTQVRL